MEPVQTAKKSANRRSAVVSGAMGYVGKATATRLARDGMSVALLFHASAENETADFIETLEGTGHHAYACNLENSSEVARTLDRIEKEMGVPCACVHAAGIKPDRKSLLDTTAEEFEHQVKTNVIGSFNFLTQCGKRLQKRKNGVLVGITTVGIVSPQFGRSLGGYIPAKWAVQGMLSMLKEELKPSGIRVYSVAPGFMAGGMNIAIPEAFKEIARRKNKSNRITSDIDIAAKISYLCSDAAKDEDKLTHVVAEEYDSQS